MQPPPFDLASRLAAIIESSDDAIVSKDLNGIIQSWNRAAERMFGYSAAEAIGQSITIIIPPERLDEERDVLARIGRGDMVDHFETERRRKDGRTVQISLSVSPIRSATGEIVGASKIARDITEQKRLLAQLEDANRLKDEFLATLSHELRTPLNAILGYAHLLRTTLDERQRARAIEIIARNGQSLSQIVSDVLDVSSILGGRMRLSTQTCDAVAILTATCDGLAPTFANKAIRLERDIDVAVARVSADPDRLQQVFWNLMTNAAKFTPQGGTVRVRIALVGSSYEVTVTDSGLGIAPEFLPHLFERFRQADGRPTRTFGGLGLGLAIVKHFVELHGGTVEGSSDGPGRGATFRVRLPALASVLEPAQAAFGHLHGQLEGLTVLAVDDDQDSLSFVRDALEGGGAIVWPANSAQSALDRLDNGRPDVIVADLSMPQMDGYEFIRAVRRRQSDDGAIPAAALTAYSRVEDRTRALSAGFQVHLTKPIDPADLVAAVSTLASRPPPKALDP